MRSDGLLARPETPALTAVSATAPQDYRVFLIVLGPRGLGDAKRHPESLMYGDTGTMLGRIDDATSTPIGWGASWPRSGRSLLKVFLNRSDLEQPGRS